MFWHLFFPLAVLAEETLSPTAVPTAIPTATPTAINTAVLVLRSNNSSVRRDGNQFDMTMDLTGASPKTTYHFRVYGGPSGNNTSVDVLSDSGYHPGYSWDSMPSLTTSDNGNLSITMRLRINNDKPSGTYYLTGSIQENSVTSNTVTIQVNDPLPTNTPTPTKVPTNTPTPTPKVTPTPVEPTPTSMPPTPVDLPQSTIAPEVPTQSPSVDSIDTISPVPTPAPQKSPNFLPLIFIGGGLLLLAPVIILNFKK